MTDHELQLKVIRLRRRIFQITLAVNVVLTVISAKAADANSLRVLVTPSTAEVRVKEPFKVALRVENRTITNQTVRVMNCSWDEHWKSSNTNVSWLEWDCSKNFAVNVAIPPGGAYTNQLEMLVLETARIGTTSFRMGFTPIDCATKYWSDEVQLIILPPVARESDSAVKQLLGTWRESDSTNTIEFQSQTAMLGPILKFDYTVRGAKLVFQKPDNIVVEKLAMDVHTNRTVIKELRSHNDPPFHDLIVPFHVTSEELEITWSDRPRIYVRVSK